jgi:hypothetical protein
MSCVPGVGLGKLVGVVSREVFSLHKSLVGCGCAKCNSVAFIVIAHAGEIGTPGDSPFELPNVRRLRLWVSRLIMATVLIQPGVSGKDQCRRCM